MGFLNRLLPTSKLQQIKRDLVTAVNIARPAGIELEENPRLAAVITSLLASPEGAALTAVRSGTTVTLCHRGDLDCQVGMETKTALEGAGLLVNRDHWSIRR